MDYKFSVGWLFGGLLIVLIGGLIVIFYRQIADNFVHGVSSYDKVKIFGIVTIIVGLICTANLHTMLLTWLVSLLFNR